MKRNRPYIPNESLPDGPLSTTQFNELQASRGKGRKRRKDGTPRAKSRELEHNEQKALFRWAWAMKSKYPQLGTTLLHAIPNGGDRDPRVAAKLKAEGAKAGVVDVKLAVARGGYHGLYIEMKAGDNKPTPEQEEFIRLARAEGYRCEVCYSWHAASEVIIEYMESK